MRMIHLDYDYFPEDDNISELQEKVLLLLEEAGIPTAINDQICKLIEDAERERMELESDEASERDNMP